MESKFNLIVKNIISNKNTEELGEQIQNWIKSKDKNVLLQSLQIIEKFLERENEKGRSILSRINILIALLGAGSAILLFFSKMIFETNVSYPKLIYFVSMMPFIFLVKSLIYSSKAIRPRNLNISTPDIIFEIQDKSYLKALRYEIVWKIWEYAQVQPFNCDRLFLFEMGLRNFVYSISSFLLLGFFIFLDKNNLLEICNKQQIIIGLILILFAVFQHLIFKLKGIWHYE